MAELNTQCEICFQDGQLQKATKFCLNCNQPLCEDCVNNHGKFRPLKSHKMLTTEENANIPSDVHNLSEFCDIHIDEKKEYICNNHYTCICFKCINDKHKLCNSIDKVGTENIPKELELLNEKWTALDDTINKLIKLYSENIHELKSTAKSAQNEIKNVISKIHSHLDKYQKQIDKCVNEECTKINCYIEDCENIKKCIERDKDELKKIVDYGNNLKVFIKLKDLNNQNTEIDAAVQELKKKRQQVKFLFAMMPPALDQIVRFIIQTTASNEIESKSF